MLVLEASKFAEVMAVLKNVQEYTSKNSGPLSDEIKEDTAAGVLETLRRLEGLDLPVSMKAVQHMTKCSTYEELLRCAKQAVQVVLWELDKRMFYGPMRQLEKYYDQQELFGKEVFDNFPSANNDISEAGTCLALERGTACVMHLMRVSEVGLKALAGAVGVGLQHDWGSYLREIDKALAAKMKASGARSADEQFYAEAAISIDNVRRAWRNPTMHVENTYSPERAEELLVATKSLMRHLATKLHE